MDYYQYKKISGIIMSKSKIGDLVESFASLEAPVFKRKVYEACLLYSMENYNYLKEHFANEEERFPEDQFHSLEEHLSGIKPTTTTTTSGPPKKKRVPTVVGDDDDDEAPAPSKGPPKKKGAKTPPVVVKEPDDDKEDENKEDETSGKKGKKKHKSYPIVFNKNAKTFIDFIISRALWEVYSIDSEEDLPESQAELEAFLIEHAPDNFPQCNITQLMIQATQNKNADKRLTNSYGLDRELRNKFDEYLNNANLSNVVASYTTSFLKLLCLYFTNRFWLEKSQTVNSKHFETILRYIELYTPMSNKTVSSGLIAEMVQYDALVNPVKVGEKSTKGSTKKRGKKKGDAKTGAAKKGDAKTSAAKKGATKKDATDDDDDDDDEEDEGEDEGDVGYDDE